MKRVFNFNSGPSMLPYEVLVKIKKELYNWKRLGVSVMEISHRSKEFEELALSSQLKLRELLSIPNNYKILFCHGGARAQFSAIPMNLTSNNNEEAIYINSGYWSNNAIEEAKKYCRLEILNVIYKEKNKVFVKPLKKWTLSNKKFAYVHYCPNETIDGIAINEIPSNFDNQIIVADFSSLILSCPLNISRFGIIYASAQKNIGLAGLTIVIIREDLLDRSSRKDIPSFLNYKILSENNSMFNTPSTFSWYVSSLIFDWIKEKGGIKKFYEINKNKSKLLYNTIDESNFYINNIDSNNRSIVNIPFSLLNSDLNKKFLNESNQFGLFALKGHRTVGNMRASLYNSMPLKGVKKLIQFMLYFANRYK